MSQNQPSKPKVFMKKTSKHPAFLDSPLGITFALGLLFLLRLGFGLCSDVSGDDPKQTYLIGLKYYCTGSWPYFGPDVIEGMQVPGSLEGLVVGLPLRILSIPEAPYLLLNLLSFGALCLLAWYFSKRLPSFPRWLLWGWLMTAPWALDFSTNILNISYVLSGSVLFFVGFLETIPAFSLKIIPPWLCHFMMGFGLFWIAQFHLSYVLLMPFIFFIFFLQAKSRPSSLPVAGAFFLLGCLSSGSFLLPTYLKYGFPAGGTQQALAFNPSNIFQFFIILGRYFSLASCEIPRFIGAHNAEREAFLREYLWAAPFTIVAFALGIVQPIAMILSALGKKHPQKDWKAIKVLAWSIFLLIYVSFLFTFKAPASHTYYLTLPAVMLYAFYVFSPWVSKKWFLTTAKALLVCNLVFHVGLAVDNFEKKSLYKNRDLFVRAIQEKNYHLVGDRRANALY
jgi:hypothetical protein